MDNVITQKNQKPQILKNWKSLLIEVPVSGNLIKTADLLRCFYLDTKDLYDKYGIIISQVGYKQGDGRIIPEPSVRLNNVPHGTSMIFLLLTDKDPSGAVLDNFAQKLLKDIQR